mmetsp:Transcript_6195/g.15414  ORF Transcript_6195/g.15414 Transcript_6195/m.15414 type:complete len:470 (+) Transcript_6195:98-1507(+)
MATLRFLQLPAGCAIATTAYLLGVCFIGNQDFANAFAHRHHYRPRTTPRPCGKDLVVARDRRPVRHRHERRSPRTISRSSPSDGENNDPDATPPTVLCAGETLWDSLPSGMYLGGAPSNVAVHLASLFRSLPSEEDSSSSDDDGRPTVAVAACVGDDQLGREARRRLALREVRTDYLQLHSGWETGMATAILDENGDATYEFNTPAAWDGLRMDGRLLASMQRSDDEGDTVQSAATRAFVMGTIAARLGNNQGATSSSTLASIRNDAPEGTVVLDVNLRSPWYAPEPVLELARGRASEGEGMSEKKLALLKLNEEELCVLEHWCDTKGEGEWWCELKEDDDEDGLKGSVLKLRMERLATELNTRRVCVTRGKDGAALLCKGVGDDDDDVFCENSGYVSTSSSADGDTVGAGDAFLAALVCSLLVQNESAERALERACALGGYVAGCRGATPEHGDAPKELRHIFSESII